MTRRSFVKHAGTGIATILASPLSANSIPMTTKQIEKSIHVSRVDSNFEREPLKRPFGFKGSSITKVWQTISYLESKNGNHGIGLGTQSVLWSDSKVFAAHTENGGNALMYAMCERALQTIKGNSFQNPIQLLDDILNDIYEYGQKITRNPDLRKTFALNALVGFDNAAWTLYAAENGIENFDGLIPEKYQKGLSAKHSKVASIPTLSYGTPMDAIEKLVDDGFFTLKIKLGAPGNQQEMLEKDKAFIEAIHKTIGDRTTPHTPNGNIPYYFDANGRYESKDTMMKLLDHAEKVGALERILILEEPFGELLEIDVHDIAKRGIYVAADESAHTDEDAITRIEMGYNSIALKAVAKTLSMTMKIAEAAAARDVPCFCADLTVNPILVDWNKCVAARLPAFPGYNYGMQETNGWQNYKYWDKMRSYHPAKEKEWTMTKSGVYETSKEFFEQSGGILQPSKHYEAMF